MKDYEDIISRFENIQDLPISEEDLGAYLEGNVNMYEMEYMNNVIGDNPMLQSIIDGTSIHSIDFYEHHGDVTELTEGFDDIDADYMSHSHHVENYDTDIHESIGIDLISHSDCDSDSPFDDLSLDLPELPFI